MTLRNCFLLLLLLPLSGVAQNYPPEAGMPGSTAIHFNSPLFIEWANGITVERGYINKSNPNATASGSSFATFGSPTNALGFPSGGVVSLGDGGTAILTFANPIADRPGFDFAVFENGSSTYLELAFVEVSSDGITYFRFANHSQTQTSTQLGTFQSPAANYLHNLAGKYSSNYGTPFDISELPDTDLLDKSAIHYVKIIDVVGSIDSAYASYDSFGNAVNDSFPTPFNSCGFDLQGVGVLDTNLGTGAFDLKSKVFLYPNPTAAFFYVSNANDAHLTLVDGNGRVLNSILNYQNQPIAVGELTSGVYFIVLDVGSVHSTLKLIVL
ncbi:T9SS type A sorting domain-containing protein [Flavobacterium sp. SM2513]|uniref:T9SS type A sorting domain-containing protein n=1 Tax=Flavobacterium sp. SM2513 TaxID=3424766 RepID=UPI003D7FBEBB